MLRKNCKDFNTLYFVPAAPSNMGYKHEAILGRFDSEAYDLFRPASAFQNRRELSMRRYDPVGFMSTRRRLRSANSLQSHDRGSSSVLGFFADIIRRRCVAECGC